MADATVLQSVTLLIGLIMTTWPPPSLCVCWPHRGGGGASLQVPLVACASATLTQYVFWLWLPSLCNEVRRSQVLFVPCAYNMPGQGVGWGRKQPYPHQTGNSRHGKGCLVLWEETQPSRGECVWRGGEGRLVIILNRLIRVSLTETKVGASLAKQVSG